jgi:predicted metalloprotease with PDZ domain
VRYSTARAFALFGLLGSIAATPAPRPTMVYTLHLDTAHLDVADVALELHDAPATFHLAMKVHAEYDARYWRYIENVSVVGTADDRAARVVREDSTLWGVTLPGGHGVVHYRVRIQPPRSSMRRAWLPYARSDGALINPPDFFLYSPEFPDTPARVELDIPRAWQIATALPETNGPTERSAADAATLLDSPILVGALREWSFLERGTTFHVVYWPLPDAAPFDTAGFVDELHRVTRAALDVFPRAPTSAFSFLIEDGAGDALEHAASVTIGVPSAELARDPRALLTELTHEFFHTWNLVAIRPAGYNRLSYLAPARTPGLWLGEGVTMYYADLLPRRAGLGDSGSTRLDHLADLLTRYYASPAVLRVAPERASLAFGDSPATNPAATAGYYLQGELLANVLDAQVRDATRERAGWDDVMRALFERSRRASDSGYTSQSLEGLVDSVCACDLDAFFASEVRGPGPIDVTPLLARLGLEARVDSAPAADGSGQALPDLRLGFDFTAPPGVLRLVLTNPATAWARAGLETGDELVALNGTPVGTYAEQQAALRTVRVGDRVRVDYRRAGKALTVTVPVTGYVRPRVRFGDRPDVTPDERSRRAAWLAGH